MSVLMKDEEMIAGVVPKEKVTVFENVTADSNGIYTSNIPYSKCVKCAYSSSGYMVIPFIASSVWKFQLLTNSGTSFVNGAGATTNIHVYVED